MYDRKWVVAEVMDSNLAQSTQQVAKEFGLPKWVAEILVRRSKELGFTGLEDYAKFLEPSLQDLPDPFALPDMGKAANRIIEAIRNGEKIAVFADYDVDGTAGAAILSSFFRSLGFEITVYQPDRQEEGYGLNNTAIENLYARGVTLLVSVDCGISNVNEVDFANGKGIEVIICDHHEVPENPPKAYAILDHKRKDNRSVIRSLCGAGMAFYFALAIRKQLREEGYFSGKIQEPDLRELLDLVALATVADLVPLVAENRILVATGLKKMRSKPTTGLRALCDVIGIKYQNVSPYHFGFALGPRINASGRLGSAGLAFAVLTEVDYQTAYEMAKQLNSINQDRVAIQNQIEKEALAMAKNERERSAFVFSADHWHEGVVGIVASRVVDQYHRPTIIITFDTQNGIGKGSCRTAGNLDLLQYLHGCKDLLVKYGGHKAAAGLSILRENLPAFKERFNSLVAADVRLVTGSDSITLPKTLKIDVQIESRDLDWRTVEALERLGPFGIGHREPLLSMYGCVVSRSMLLKELHLKLTLKVESSDPIEAMWFYCPDGVSAEEGEVVDMVFSPKKNSFRGQQKIDLRLKDLKMH